MAEYHEAFWVVVGTAGPVLLVASTVAVTQSLRAISRAAEREGMTDLFKVRWMWRVVPRMTSHWWAMALAQLAVTVEALLVVLALDNLASRRDGSGAVTLAQWLCFVAVVLVFAQAGTATIAAAREQLHRAEARLARVLRGAGRSETERRPRPRPRLDT